MPERPTTAYTEPYTDEISLRDLYLILKRGLPFIIGLALVAGLAAFVISSLLPKVYEAQSTTLVTPPPVRVGESGTLSFEPDVNISFESYETLALSQPVLEAAVEAVPEAGLTASGLREAGGVDRLLGPQPNAASPLSVTHAVRSTDPGFAAALANAWAQSTLDTVRTSLLATLDPAENSTNAELANLRARLEAAEGALESFDASDTSPILTQDVTRLTEAISDAEGELVPLPGVSDLPTTDLVNAPKLNLAQEIAANEALLASLRAQSGAGSTGAGQLEEQITFREALLTSLRSRRALLAQQVESYRRDFGAAQAELAALTRERATLERTLENARTAYQNVAALQPTIAYVAQLAPSGARLLSEAAVPNAPVGPRRGLNTALALVLGGVLGLLFVFLREAVSAKDTGRDAPKNAREEGGSEARRYAPPRYIARRKGRAPRKRALKPLRKRRLHPS